MFSPETNFFTHFPVFSLSSESFSLFFVKSPDSELSGYIIYIAWASALTARHLIMSVSPGMNAHEAT
jgi:hypothetical protein